MTPSRAFRWLLLTSVAACASEQPAYEPAPAPAEAEAGAPVIQFPRTGLEFQPDRGTKTGDSFLGGKLVAERVTDNSALGVLHGTVQLKSKSAESVAAQYRFLFYDDKAEAIGPIFSTWTPFAVGDPYGAITLHGTSPARRAVYFVLEVQ